MAKAYLVQMNIVWRNKMQNFATVRRLLSSTSLAPGSLIVLPEMFATGFVTEDIQDLSESFAAPDSGETAAFLQALSDETGCLIQGGGIDSVLSKISQLCRNLWSSCRKTSWKFL
jgi:predicted amidohydrolase